MRTDRARGSERRKLRAWQFATMLLAGLGLVMGGAHVLELPPKMRYDAPMYAAVTSTLYPLFGMAGGPIQAAAAFAALCLSYLNRARSSFRLTLSGAVGLVISLVVWFVIVAPVNAHWQLVLDTAPATVPAAYQELRAQWEYGHAAAFVAWLTGYGLLLWSVLEIDEASK